MADYRPLVDPSDRTVADPEPVHECREWAAEVLAEQQVANLYDDHDMRTAAIMLERVLRELLASLDAEGGES